MEDWSSRMTWYCCMNCAAAASSGAPASSPSSLRSTGSSPFSRARASTACTSRANPRVASACSKPRRPQPGVAVAGEQLLEDDVLLRRRQQPQRSGVEVGGGVAADEAVGEGVEGRAQRGRHGAPEPGGDPVAELLGRLAAEGQREHRLRGGAAPLDPVDDRLDQRRGLAGAGAGQHEQRPARVVDHRLLERVQRRGCRRERTARGGAGTSSRTITSSAADRIGQRRQGAGRPCSHHSSRRVSCGQHDVGHDRRHHARW